MLTTLDPTTASACLVLTSGPRGSTAQHFTYRTSGGRLELAWAIPRTVTPGTWTVTALCQEPGLRSRLTASYTIAVANAAAQSSKKPLRGGVISGKPVIKHLAASGAVPIAKGTGGGMATPVVGLGASGGNPFPYGQCTYHGYETRPDVYDTSVASGAPRGGVASGNPKTSEDYWWNAWRWASLASTYGHFPEGGTPAVGAIVVFSREYFGGPDNDEAGGQYGHVAYVTAVSSNGKSFTVSQRNVRGNPNITTATVSVRSGETFIYGGPAGNAPGGGGPTPTPTPPPSRTADGVQHALVLTKDGGIHETIFGTGNAPTGGTFANVANGVAITGYQTKDGIQHALALDTAGGITETTFGTGGAPAQGKFDTVPNGIAITGYQTADGVQHALVLTKDGGIHETIFGTGNAPTGGTFANVANGVAITGYQTKDGIQHALVLDTAGGITETTFGTGGAPAQGKFDTVPNGIAITGYQTADGVQHALVLTKDGGIHETIFGTGNAPTGGTFANVANGVAITGYQTKDGIQHALVLDTAGGITETTFGTGGAPAQGKFDTVPNGIAITGYQTSY